MLGMFNTGATTRHGEMVGFNRGINLVESYPLPLPFLVCHVLSEKFFRGENAYCISIRNTPPYAAGRRETFTQVTSLRY